MKKVFVATLLVLLSRIALAQVDVAPYSTTPEQVPSWQDYLDLKNQLETHTHPYAPVDHTHGSGDGAPPINTPPVASAGVDRPNAAMAAPVALDGSNSFDADGDPLAYTWTLSRPTGSVATLNDPSSATPSFTPDIEGNYVAGLVVNDGQADSALDTALIVAVAQGSRSLAQLCANPGVLVCDGFENGPRWPFFNPSDGGTDPSIVDDPEGVYEGDHAFQLVLDGNGPADVSGSVAFDIPPTDTVYMHAMIKWEKGTFANLDSFSGSKGPKWFQFVAGNKSCSGDSINIVNTQNRNIWGLTMGCGGKPFRVSLPSGDRNIQPKSDNDRTEYKDGGCTYRHSRGNSGFGTPPKDLPNGGYDGPCAVYTDGEWHRVELRVAVGEGVKLWVNGELVFNMAKSDGGGGITEPRRRLFLTGYMTGHEAGNPKDKSWRVWYDNLIISQNCITSCGS